MCGITGFVGGRWPSPNQAEATLERMAGTIRYRGPDRTDLWIDPAARVGLAHNRLAIQDLTEAGNQPMHSESGRYVIVFNGEIYNHQNIREQVSSAGTGSNWNGRSDTETLLVAIDHWGIEEALSRCVGMFAFALWDKSQRTLTLARDRLGEKPLYYGHGDQADGPLLFASELKAFRAHPEFTGEIDRQALTLLLRYNYVPAPFSIYRGINKLPPGCLLTLREGELNPVVEPFWSGAATAEAGLANPLTLNDIQLIDELQRLLELAIGQQMISDVPLGAFLSGGVDSSVVVALMQKLSSQPIKTFTIGFHEKRYDEAEHAKALARHLGTEHTELYVGSTEAQAVIPRLPQVYDEPFADSSQIPTYLVATLAREHVTVALSGDGGDEMFGGYNRYRLTSQIWDRVARVPKPLRTAAARAITALPSNVWTNLGSVVSGTLPRWAQVDRLGDKVHKGASLLASKDVSELYSGMISTWNDPSAVVLGAREPPSQATGVVPPLNGLGTIERMMALDMLGYLPNDILTKVDRAAMAVSLETRVPYLDYRVVEFAWRIPLKCKIKNGETKWILRQLLYRHVPKELIERPKMGFAVPIGDWLRGPLRDWAEALLDEQRIRAEGYFRPEPIRRLWNLHISGRADGTARLWVVLMFQSWLESTARIVTRDDSLPCSLRYGHNFGDVSGVRPAL